MLQIFNNVKVSSRTGSVLGRNTILKLDHVMQMQKPLAARISGAPNFRRLRDYRVYGVATASVYGIRAIFNLLKYGVRVQKLSAVAACVVHLAISLT